MFRQFWSDYKVYSGDHPVFNQGQGVDLSLCVPFFIHGDEGRGQLKRPYMVISTQFAIGLGGVHAINDNTYLVCVELAFFLLVKTNLHYTWYVD